jgi:hypothetical protein
MDPYRQSWIDLLRAERERRLQARLGAAGGDPRDWLLAKLDEMHERMAAAPDYLPPPAAVAAAECLLLDRLGSRG